ncbi:MAG: hypothetical protein ACRDAX_10150 [Propionibacteriaceae bacterium]
MTLKSGALNNADLMSLVLARLDGDNAFKDIEEFLEVLTRTWQVCSQL